MSDRDDTSAPTGSPAPSATAKRETGGETTKAPTTSAAERQRRHRERRRAGVAVYQVEVTQEAKTRLIQRDWLNEAEAQDRKSVTAALEDLLDCYGRGTLDPEPVAVSTSTGA